MPSRRRSRDPLLRNSRLPLLVELTPPAGAKAIDRRENVFVGNPGTGKTHLGIALAAALIDAEEFDRMLEGVVIDNTGLFNDRLQEWENFYNFNRPHGELGGQTPYERLRQKTSPGVNGHRQLHASGRTRSPATVTLGPANPGGRARR